MTKQEQTQLAVMCEFIYHIHSMAGMEVPEDFNPEEQAIVISNALKYKGGLEMANQLLLAEKGFCCCVGSVLRNVEVLEEFE